MTRRLAVAAAVVVPAGFLGLFFAYPVATILVRGLVEGSPLDVWRRTSTGRVAWFTLWQAALSTLLTLLVGLPAAWALARRAVPGRRVLRAVMVVPFVLPTLVVGAAVQALMGRLGLRTGTVGAILLAHVVFNVAVVVRIVGGHWALLDPRAEDAARALGAPPWRVVREVTLPRLAPALWSAASIVFLFCSTSFGIILTVGGPSHPTIETEVWRHATQRTDLATAAALAVVQLVAVVALVAAGSTLERRAAAAAPSRGPVAPRRIRTPGQALAVAAAVAPALLLVAAPLAVMAERSLASGGGYGLQHYRALSGTAGSGLVVAPLDAVRTSLAYATVAMAVAVVVGGLAAAVVALAPGRRGRALDLAVMVPLGTSAVTLGFGILVAFDSSPLDWRSSRAMVPVAQALVGIPFVVRAVAPALRAVDPRQREAASVLGASPARVRREVDLPVAARALAVGAAFAFAVSLGEFGATSFLARPDAPTVPVAMYRLLGRPGEALQGQAMALGVLLAVLTAASAALVERARPRDAVGW